MSTPSCDEPFCSGSPTHPCPGPWRLGPFFLLVRASSKGRSMADTTSPIMFEDIPLAEARRMGRGPRVDPQLYQELRTRLSALSTHAVQMTIPEGNSPTTMMNRILRVAEELGESVTIRKVTGGLLFWRSTDEDIQQAK